MARQRARHGASNVRNLNWHLGELCQPGDRRSICLSARSQKQPNCPREGSRIEPGGRGGSAQPATRNTELHQPFDLGTKSHQSYQAACGPLCQELLIASKADMVTVHLPRQSMSMSYRFGERASCRPLPRPAGGYPGLQGRPCSQNEVARLSPMPRISLISFVACKGPITSAACPRIQTQGWLGRRGTSNSHTVSIFHLGQFWISNHPASRGARAHLAVVAFECKITTLETDRPLAAEELEKSFEPKHIAE